MKIGNITITQDDVDTVADRLVREAGGDIAQVNGNKVAVACGMAKANPELYKLYNNWEARRTAEGIAFIQQAPSELTEQLKAHLARSSELLVNLTLGVTGKAVAEERQKCAITLAALGERLPASEAELAAVRAQLKRLSEANAELEVENSRLRRDGEEKMQLAAKSDASKAELQRQHDMLLDRLSSRELKSIGDTEAVAMPGHTEDLKIHAAEQDVQANDDGKFDEYDFSRFDLDPDDDNS